MPPTHAANRHQALLKDESLRLLAAPIGALVRVTGFKGAGLSLRLSRLGLHPGDQLKILRRGPLGGPLLISVGDRELALGHDVARKIEVEAV